VYSALFLILAFCNTSSLLFILQLEFLPITLLVVYVGAIAVLFLFVLMMLNIKYTELKEENSHYIPIASVFAIVFFFELFILLRSEYIIVTYFDNDKLPFIADAVINVPSNIEFSFPNNSEHNLKAIGFILFIEYFFHFIVSGYILLFAMIGAIVLTVNKKFISKSQNIYAQVLRDYNTSIVYYT